MTVFVIRDGKLVDRDAAPSADRISLRSPFPSPQVSRMTPFDSPVTGREISSWRERDRDMNAVGAVDPRDLPRKPFDQRRANIDARRALDADA